MSSRVYVGRLPPDLREDDLIGFFRGIKVNSVNLKGVYGFVEFDNPADAEDAVRDFDGRSLLGERIVVQQSRESRRRDDYDRPPPRSFAPPRRGVRINVIGVPERTSWQDLKDFGRNGNNNIMYADLDRNNPRVGIIEFPTIADAEDVLRRLDGADLNGARVQLEIVPEGAPDQRDQRDDRRPPRDYGRGGGYDRDDRGGYDRDDRGGYPPRHDDRPRREYGRDDRYEERPPRREYDRDRSPPRRREDDRYDDRR